MITTYLEDVIMDSNDGEETTPRGTQRTEMGSTDVNTTPIAVFIGSSRLTITFLCLLCFSNNPTALF
jgi:hypothetical protein